MLDLAKIYYQKRAKLIFTEVITLIVDEVLEP